ncbi:MULTISPECIES: cation diffusion facilitator family transporter [unclassified Duganella]|uniref:cation diffusion facilitator family transporter n=1 Tax=unclassified Duganella TaxID=2636909 RepID=UPI00088D9BE6|nr:MULTISPECIES: cation diffusion facilitator family transporter [unclassified Duganella]SDG22518.1 cobalt-zinc-cadmium efflux system protein [Duganella sp. OV458]SDJ25899.1 cobalt-zinc-cadmium efflux system protein [Duganella sp. OV510]
MSKHHDHDHHHDHGHHGHDHSHAHGHHHHGDPNTMGRAFVIAIVLNSVFVAVEFFYGFLANSTALMADAGHNLSDVLGLMLAWGAAILAKRVPTSRYTYGLRSSSILAALFNAMLLMAACGGIAWEAVQQLIHPDPVAGTIVSIVAGIGILINGFSAWLFMAGSKDDINIRGAYLHLAADAAISLGVLVAGVIVGYTSWNWIDPAVSMVIVVIIVLSTWALMKQSLRLVMAAVPDNVDRANIETWLRQQPGVSALHDLHIWAMSTTENALTVQLVMPAGYPGDAAIDAISKALREDYAIQHSTLQVRLGGNEVECCLQAPAPAAAPAHKHAH